MVGMTDEDEYKVRYTQMRHSFFQCTAFPAAVPTCMPGSASV